MTGATGPSRGPIALDLPEPPGPAAGWAEVEAHGAAWADRVMDLGVALTPLQRMRVKNGAVLGSVLHAWITAPVDLAPDALPRNVRPHNPDDPWASLSPPAGPYDRAWLDQALFVVLDTDPTTPRRTGVDPSEACAHQEVLAAAFLAAGACPTPEGLLVAARWGNPRLLQRLLDVPPRGETAWPSLASCPGRTQPGVLAMVQHCAGETSGEVLDLLGRVGVPFDEAQPVTENVASGDAGETPFLRAAGLGNTAMLKALHARGADPDQVMDRNTTALHRAVSNGNHEVVDLLLEMGADPQRRLHTPNAPTPMQLAAWQGRSDTVDHLLRQGVEPFPSRPTVTPGVAPTDDGRDTSVLDALRDSLGRSPPDGERAQALHGLLVRLEQRWLGLGIDGASVTPDAAPPRRRPRI